MEELVTYLEDINACEDAQAWADSQESYEKAWEICERGDWMLWIVRNQNVDLKKRIKAKTECAKLVKYLMKDERSLKALYVAEDFYNCDASREVLEAAYVDAADAVADAVAAVDAVDAIYAAAAAADAVSDDVVAAAADAFAAVAAADAAADAATAVAVVAAADAAAADDAYADVADAKARTLKKCADIVREYIKFEELNINEK